MVNPNNCLEMKQTFYILILFLVLTSLPAFSIAQNQLMPVPQKINYGSDKFQLSNARIFKAKDFSLDNQKAINQFIAVIKEQTGISLSITGSKEAVLPILVFKSEHTGSALPLPNETTGKESREAYTINVTVKKVIVTAKSDAGLFYALQTLQQLITSEGKNSFIPQVDIEDYPAFAYRGVMMDFSHGGLLTEAEIKRQINFLASWKLNQYFFYNEVNIEMKGYPLVNYHTNYSQQQIRRIIAYAKEKHVDVIPFVELYGHLHELLRVEKYASLAVGNYGHELDPRNPKTQVLIKDWLKQYAALFPSPFIHIGFDETWETERLSITDTSIAPKKLYLNQLDFVTKTLQGYGKTVMVWTDISRDYPDIISQFPKKVIPVVWEYSSDTAVMNDWIRPVVKENFPFFVQSAVDGWQHVYPSANYTYNNIDLCLKTGADNNAIGYITSVWADAAQTLQRNSWLFMAYGCIGSWQSKPVDRYNFILDYCRIEYPSISKQMANAFDKMAESQSHLAKSLGSRHTLTDMWENPFSSYSIKNTNEHTADLKKARIAAEEAQESLINSLKFSPAIDTAFIKTLLVNTRLLDYTAMRFLWAKTIEDRWNYTMQPKEQKDKELISKKDDSWIMFYDLSYSAHGLVTDLMDYSIEIKQEYEQAWLSENMPYRLGTMSGRFDAEYLFWRDLYMKVRDYENHAKKDDKHLSFEETFKLK
jgi:hexosaminidase